MTYILAKTHRHISSFISQFLKEGKQKIKSLKTHLQSDYPVNLELDLLCKITTPCTDGNYSFKSEGYGHV